MAVATQVERMGDTFLMRLDAPGCCPEHRVRLVVVMDREEAAVLERQLGTAAWTPADITPEDVIGR